MVVGQLKTNNAEINIKKICAGKFNSNENQLKIIYYAAKDSKIKIKATEFKGKQIRSISRL